MPHLSPWPLSLVLAADGSSPTRVYHTEKLIVPAWIGRVMRKAPDAEFEMMHGRLSGGILKSLPGTELTYEVPIAVNGFPGT